MSASAVPAVVLGLLASLTLWGAPAAPAASAPLWFDGPAAAEANVTGDRFTDGHGREVVLRGFNVSGEVKLDENKGLPFASTADARLSAEALRELGGANTVRFLLSWAYAEPAPGQPDGEYLRKVTDQMRVFLDAGFRVLPDFHQDLYSRHLFHKDSWYTGDGAPKWAVDAAGYPREDCGACVHWGQNMTQNQAVKQAKRDFWRNRVLNTSAGPVGVQDAFLATAEKTMAHLRQNLTAGQFSGVVGLDVNEPYAGEFTEGQNSRTWERDLLFPFYERLRARMDRAGWQDKPMYAEPNVFWNGNIDLLRQEGGFLDERDLGPDYVFNAHFYDQKAQSGVLMPGKAGDGQYAADFEKLRERAATLRTASVLTEFGHPLTGYTSDKAPSVGKAMYQALDSRLPGARWWEQAAGSGPVLSATQWQWDIYSGRHHELMNGNPEKVLTEADAWNGEDFSSVRLNDSGAPELRQDARLIDRLYPSAVAGRTLAFTYEDRSRDGGTTMTWNRVPSTLPNVAKLVGSGQYGVLVWRAADTAGAPTELHLPRSFDPARTTVVSDLATVTGLPAYTGGQAVATAPEPGGTDADRLLLTAPAGAGAVHYALVADGTAAPTAEVRAAAKQELDRWAAATFR
ncbi:cellulase family glycosylhydrolase [Streptomyces capparidis]